MYGASTCTTLGIPHTPTIAVLPRSRVWPASHVGTCAFDDIAQHVTIAPDGMIWTGRDWNKIPASVGYGMNVGAFMFEMVGNFDTGHDRLEGEQLESVLTVVDTVQRRFRLPVHSLLFHREVPQTDKTCPGQQHRQAGYPQGFEITSFAASAEIHEGSCCGLAHSEAQFSRLSAARLVSRGGRAASFEWAPVDCGGGLSPSLRDQAEQAQIAYLDGMRFSPHLLDEIRARLPVSQVVGRKVALKKKGREYTGLSPFKTEKSPSFFVNDQKGFYHCFASGEHGDIFTFLMKTEGLAFPEAVERLAEEAGVPMPKADVREEARHDERQRLYALLEASAAFFVDCFKGKAGSEARRYVGEARPAARDHRDVPHRLCAQLQLGAAASILRRPDSRSRRWHPRAC